MFRRAAQFSRRDAVLLMVGATAMHLVSSFLPGHPTADSSIIINTHLKHVHDTPDTEPLPGPPQVPIADALRVQTVTTTATTTVTLSPDSHVALQTGTDDLPFTSIVDHAPGWTLFRNLYMSDGTLYILSDNRSFPEIRLMTSTGMAAENNPENIAAREPTSHDMDYITPAEARRRWGGTKHNRVSTIQGNTLLVWEPSQFLRHYYHLVAELFFGAQAFWHGAWSAPSEALSNSAKLNHPAPPPLDRVIFAHSNADGWRDDPGFNRFFMRAAFPSITVEVEEDWQDRVVATSNSKGVDRAFHFPYVLLTDRSAAHRGVICGSETQRIAAEAWDYMRKQHKLMGIQAGAWWEPVRSSILNFAGLEVDRNDMTSLTVPKKVVITYVSRQGVSRRKLTDASHESLVKALTELCERKGWELIVMQAEKLTKDAQLEVASKTTVMLGVHGNGLSHLLWMPPTKVSAVIEIFYPGGFAHDYHWTSRALGMSHYGVWNNKYFTYPNEPKVDYPQGFQENNIPVDGKTVAQLVEDRIAGKV
ncbi:hypothetical protein CYLTODRAFT_435285 [Cylindrobasidium torrendii FP15055 ss-10]|uniref:Glycosyltransferase 61 catalytic domain-containing protein n=1 Tax=Cylindrobasidium torrendii FP15055 ss-10 TaxID=1314674 RepID=A0A0D7BLR9_9AGAR|nr:hypothetical protein CYLTODRAFT_435285 [Cylindrobasidium torrendii FP15055 ss-10]